MLGDGGVSRIREFGQIACRPEVSIYFVILGSSFNEQETRTKLLDLKSLKFKKKSSYITLIFFYKKLFSKKLGATKAK